MNSEQFLVSLHKLHYLFFLGVIHSLSSGISYRIPNTSDNLFPKEHLNKINGKM